MSRHAYALVHVYWTIPLAIALWWFGRPVRTTRECLRTSLLIAIAFTATIPWDSYLIRTKVWSYPPEAVFGYTLYDIPYEELFFFVIQTYITSTIYAVVTKPIAGFLSFLACILISYLVLQKGGTGTYMALIVLWASPFLLLLWSIASVHIMSLPLLSTFLSVLLPTFYFWALDTVSLQRGTWVIEDATKLGIHLWTSLDIEEAFFFLITNVLIVFGNIASDFVWAIHDSLPHKYGRRPPNSFPPLRSLFSCLFSPYDMNDIQHLHRLQSALSLLRDKSKSFYTASMLFEGALRLDLLSLYSVCRYADDLVDETSSADELQKRLAFLRTSLKKPASAESSQLHLLTDLRLPEGPFEELFAGFDMDARFLESQLPITDEKSLRLYAERVAASVAEMCVRLVWLHYGTLGLSQSLQNNVIAAARNMGCALQYVNIARDVPEDLKIGRIYLPHESLRPCTQEEVSKLSASRFALLNEAEVLAYQSVDAIKHLPKEVQGGMRAACLVYLDISREIRQCLKLGKHLERAKASKLRRLAVAWQACQM